MNEISDEGSSLRVELERSTSPQCNLQVTGPWSGDVQNITKAARAVTRETNEEILVKIETGTHEHTQTHARHSESITKSKKEKVPVCRLAW